jgi:hypothetical protein
MFTPSMPRAARVLDLARPPTVAPQRPSALAPAPRRSTQVLQSSRAPAQLSLFLR